VASDRSVGHSDADSGRRRRELCRSVGQFHRRKDGVAVFWAGAAGSRKRLRRLLALRPERCGLLLLLLLLMRLTSAGMRILLATISQAALEDEQQLHSIGRERRLNQQRCLNDRRQSPTADTHSSNHGPPVSTRSFVLAR